VVAFTKSIGNVERRSAANMTSFKYNLQTLLQLMVVGSVASVDVKPSRLICEVTTLSVALGRCEITTLKRQRRDMDVIVV